MDNQKIPREYSKCYWAVILICSAIILYEVLALLTWEFEISALSFLQITSFTAKPYREMFMLLIALVLLLLRNENPSISAKIIAVAGASLICLLNLLISIEHFTTFIIITKEITFLTIFNFVLTGIALLALTFDRKKSSVWIYQTIATIVAISALFSLLGYAYHVDITYALVADTQMEIRTSVLLILTSIVIMLERPNKGLMKILLEDSLTGKLLRRIPIIIFSISAILSLISNDVTHYLQWYGDSFGDLLTLLSTTILLIVTIWVSTNFLTQQEKQLQLSRRRIQTQQDILQIIESGAEFQFIAERILKVICNNLNWNMSEIWLIDHSELKRTHIWYEKKLENLLKLFLSSNTIFKVGEGFPGVIWQNKKSIWENNFLQNYPSGRNIESLQFNSMVGIPIISGSDIIGVMTFFSQSYKELDNNMLTILEVIGTQIGDYISHKSTEEKIYRIKERDILTGFMNRLTFEEKLNNKIIQNPDKLQAIITFDVDKFRKVNEAFGYDAGDILLQQISERLSKQNLTENNLICRLGADKFVFVPAEIKKINQAVEYAYKIFSICDDNFYINEKEFHLAMSIGISIFPKDGKESGVLLKNSDLALSQAKKTDGNSFQFFTNEILSTFSEKLSLESELREAVSQDQFVLYFQPKINLKTGIISSVESLLRWQHPEKGMIPPSSFMHIMEDNGMIIPITEWIIREVCNLVATKSLSIPIAINISSHHFRKEYNLASYLKQMIQGFHINTDNIELEITETVLMEDTNKVLSMLANLKSMGFTLTLDDFGTKFSSLNYLKNISVDKIKIDKSFVDNIPENIDNVAIIKAIITLFHALNKHIVAEGVENIEQVKFLIKEGCDEIQGYYFSKPLPLNELQALLHAHTRFKLPGV